MPRIWSLLTTSAEHPKITWDPSEQAGVSPWKRLSIVAFVKRDDAKDGTFFSMEFNGEDIQFIQSTHSLHATIILIQTLGRREWGWRVTS